MPLARGGAGRGGALGGPVTRPAAVVGSAAAAGRGRYRREDRCDCRTGRGS